MVNFYRCKKCGIKFTAPLKISTDHNRTTYVCPTCKSHNWEPLDW